MNTSDAICKRCDRPIRWWALTRQLCGYCRLMRDIEALEAELPEKARPLPPVRQPVRAL